MDTVKDRIGIDLSEADDVKKRSKNILNNYIKKVLMTQITTVVWSLI